MPTWASQDVEDWIPGLQAAFTQEDALHQAEQQNRGNTAWDCPVRRVAFYSGSIPNSDFASAIPSPGRARRGRGPGQGSGPNRRRGLSRPGRRRGLNRLVWQERAIARLREIP